MKLTDAEWQIMKALWEAWPATARDIAGRLPADVIVYQDQPVF